MVSSGMASTFSNRTGLITGAASGIGLAVARRLAADGAARLILVDRDSDALGRVELPCEIDSAAGDVSDERFWESMADRLGRIDHAVVNAGVSGGSTIADHTYAEWRRILSINLDGAFLTLRAAMRAMAGRGGTIVATASAAGLKPEPGVAAYGASKAALIHLVKVAAKEGAARNIRVNAIAPGGVETPIWDGLPFFEDLVRSTGTREAAFAKMATIVTPLGRYAKPEEIAEQIAFLLSEASALITGATLVSDGGYTL